jgi:hypothetical protein
MAESKQDVVVRLVQEGTHTRQEIKDAADCTSGALASYLSGMRNAAKFTGAAVCPMEVVLEDGKKVFTAVTFEAAEEAKAAKAATASASTSTKTPAERLEAATKRVDRCDSALDKAKERYEAAEDNRELELRFNKAEIEAELASIELKRAEALVVEDEDADADDIEAEDELI